MKKRIHFSKIFLHCFILSVLLIGAGIFGYITKGINFGIDFQAGFIQKIKIAPTALELSYKGPLGLAFSQSGSDITITATSLDGASEAFEFKYASNPTIKDFKEGLAKIEGLNIELKAPEQTPLKEVFSNSESSPKLSEKIFRLHYIDSGMPIITADEVRLALSSLPSALIQQLGEPSERYFQIRLAEANEAAKTDTTSETGEVSETAKAGETAGGENANTRLKALINDALNSVYGEDNIAIMSTDFVGSTFSAALSRQAGILIFGALALIFIYAMIRFQWNFALGAVLSLIHDAIIMVAFIVWTQMEFSSTTIAALLTIIGYSINDTIVIFDRIREKATLEPKLECNELLDFALSEVFGRTIITTLTTMLAVASLFFFTTGAMKDFALVLLVGLVSGTYSSIYTASLFVSATSKGKKAGELITRGKKASGELSGVVV